MKEKKFKIGDKVIVVGLYDGHILKIPKDGTFKDLTDNKDILEIVAINGSTACYDTKYVNKKGKPNVTFYEQELKFAVIDNWKAVLD